jgi:alpha-D-ribose 1-methylphosphonate 5-triphosphate diphosphatase
MTAEIIEGARVVLEDRVARLSVRIEDGRITGLDSPRDGARVVDGRGFLLAPAMVDVHGDAFERQVQPRPGVAVPLDVALLETDRHLAANGIATAYHALTLSWEPGLRSIERARATVAALAALQPRLTAENRLQLRWETFCFEALPVIEAALAATPAPSLAFNDHTAIMLLSPEVPLQDRPFALDDCPLADTRSGPFLRKMAKQADRAGIAPEAYAALLTAMWDRRADVPARIAEVAAMARGLPMLSHDDTQPETRAFYRGLGSRISEFPMHERAALAAREGGDWIVLGAPNAMRGGSHLGSPGAADMIVRGLCDILASDYYHPAMLGAVARLLADGVACLPALWRLVAANPAAAMGLADRGRIAPGLRADLVLIDWPEGQAPATRRTWAAGRRGYAAL